MSVELGEDSRILPWKRQGEMIGLAPELYDSQVSP